MVFFVLSGFVIYYSTASKPDSSFGAYFRRRFLRIYPTYCFALIVTLAIAAAQSIQQTRADLNTPHVVSNVFLIPAFKWGYEGAWSPTFFGNLPLWSLSFEWWFYMAFFPIWKFVAPDRRVHVVGAASLLASPIYQLTHNAPALYVAYFLLWWAGVEIAREFIDRNSVSFRRQLPTLAYLAISVLFWCGVCIWHQVQGEHLSFDQHPFLPLRHFGACFAVVVTVIHFPALLGKDCRSITRVLAGLAGMSYALYVLHYPIACTTRWLIGINNPALEFPLYVIICLAAAYFAEHILSKTVTKLCNRPSHSKPA